MAIKKAGLLTILILSFFLPKALEATIYGKVQGNVIAEDTGKGLMDVDVQLYELIIEGSKDDGNTYATSTDKNGNYVFDMVKSGRYIIEFSPPKPYMEDLNLFYLEKEGIQILNVEKGKTIIFNKIISVGGTISGTVYIKKNGVMSGLGYAALHLKQENGRLPLVYISLPDGKYKFSGVALNEDMKLRAGYPGYGLKTKNLKSSSIQELTDIDFLFDSDNKTGIEVNVNSSLDGSPIANATVFIDYEDKPLQKDSCDTNEFGKASIIDMEPGNCKVRVFYYYNGKIFKNSKEDVLIEKGKTTNIDISIDLS